MTQRGSNDKVTATGGNAGWIEVFRAGTHTDASGRKMKFTRSHLDEIVASYDPATHEAPVVVGHPKTDDPALGWISELKRDGDSLYALERDVHPEFAQMREAGLYRKRSASFYLPDSPGNPTPGKMHLRHVGNLGAMPPAVKAMADKARTAAFNEDDGAGVVEFNDMTLEMSWSLTDLFNRFRDFLIEKEGVDVADRIVPRYQIDSLRAAGLVNQKSDAPSAYSEGDEDADDIQQPAAPDTQPTPEELEVMTDQQKKLDADRVAIEARQAELEAREAEFNEREKAAQAEARRAGAASFADQLVSNGRLTPGQRDSVVELLALVDGADPVSFGEGEDEQSRAPGEILRELLNDKAQVIQFNEKANDRQRASAPADFSAPSGSAVDADSLADLNKAQEYIKAHPGTSLIEAVQAVQRAG